MGMALSTVLSNRNLLKYDFIRTKLNQQLKGAIEIAGATAREAGENLSANFPAIEIVNGVTSADEVILRRAVVGEILKLCTPISAGTSADQIHFADASGTLGCLYSDNLFNFSSWQANRLEAEGSLLAYAYDSSTKVGEFFEYTGEVDTGSELYLERGSGVWENDYSSITTSIYIIEQWQFKLEEDVLQVIENDYSDDPYNIIFGVSDFQVSINYPDGTSTDSFTVDDNWTQIASLQISITVEDSFAGKQISRTMEAEFFPRNILSN